MKRLHVFFTGQVQGVGFRFTARQVARQFKLAGWVKNLKDGEVELLVEGEENELKEFLALIRSKMERHILDVRISWSQATREFHQFEILQ